MRIPSHLGHADRPEFHDRRHIALAWAAFPWGSTSVALPKKLASARKFRKQIDAISCILLKNKVSLSRPSDCSVRPRNKSAVERKGFSAVERTNNSMNKLIGTLAVAMVALFAPLSQAALQISYSVNGAAPVVCALNPVSAGPAVCAAFSVAPVTVSILTAGSNSPGTPGLAQSFGSTLQIVSSSAATLDIWTAAQDFVTPTTPPAINFSSSISTTSTTGTGTSGLTSCVDTTNGLAPPTAPFCAAGPSLTNTTLGYGPAPSSTSNTVSSLILSLGSPYSLTEHIHLVLGANSNINVITSTVLTPVPEPASIALLGGVLLFASTRLIRRKRNQSSQA